MIRRGFWLVVGAAGGIIGYRRVSSVSRQVAQTLGAAPKGVKSPAARKRHWARETLRFTRDVREGMDLYFDRHRGGEDPTLNRSTSARAATVTGKRALNSTGTDKREDRDAVGRDRTALFGALRGAGTRHRPLG
jgi:hypothetical protein